MALNAEAYNMKKVAIIDFELGNLFSVRQACLSLGADAFFTNDHKEIAAADMIILPGVGAFGKAMENLKRLELDKVVKDVIASGKPFMGVCLGLQLLFEASDEFGSHEGLGIVKGNVKKFPATNPEGQKLLIPQIAWNTIHTNQSEKWQKSPLKTMENGEYFYFVHSYYVSPASEDVKLSTTKYEGIEYCSSILKDNIFAVQFHPEKSGKKGIEVYKNWLGA